MLLLESQILSPRKYRKLSFTMLASEIHKTGIIFILFCNDSWSSYWKPRGLCKIAQLWDQEKWSFDSQSRIFKNIFHITSRKRIKYVQFDFSVESLCILTALKAGIFEWHVWPEQGVRTLLAALRQCARTSPPPPGKKRSGLCNEGEATCWFTCWLVEGAQLSSLVGALTVSSPSRFCGHHPS